MDRVTDSKTALDLKIVDILRQYETALSILKEYPNALERFKLAIKQDTEAVGPARPQPTDEAPHHPAKVISTK